MPPRARRPPVSARTDRRSGRRAGVCRRIPRSAAPREDAVWHLAGGHRRAATSSTTSATRTTSRCATCSKRSSRTRRTSIAATLREIERYTKLFWINTGPYNNLTARKFVLALHAGRVRRRRACRRARRRALSAARRRNARRSCSTRLRPMFFDPAFDPTVTSKTPPPGKDILDGERQQPLRRRDDGATSRGSRSGIR